LIVVDDGSIDGTAAILDELRGAEPRLRVLRQEHQGIVSALNCGLACAKGMLIARMDADDESHPERLTEQEALLAREPGVGLVGCLVSFGGDRSRAGGYALHVDWMNSVLTPEAIATQRFIESPFAHPSVVFRRELLDQCGGYREGDFPEDYELWLRWLDAGVRMTKVPRELLTWHDRPERLSRADPRYSAEAFYRCKAIYLAQWLRRELERSRSVLVWGAGRLTRRRAEYLLEHGIEIAGYIDIDPGKIGRRLDGRPVLGPTDLPPVQSCFVLGYVAKRGARDLIRGHLQARGYVEGKDFLVVA
jgi:glycosyltransferase involved in cell wall biosynthesis